MHFSFKAVCVFLLGYSMDYCIVSAAKFTVPTARKLSVGIVNLSLLLQNPSVSLARIYDDPETLRFTQGLQALENLDGNWESVVKGQGDNIRRKLGTVYSPPVCDSPLCSFSSFIPKYVRSHDQIDVSEFEGPSSELLQALNQADFLAYSSVFSDYGNGGGGVDYIAKSREQVQKAIRAMKEVIEVIERD